MKRNLPVLFGAVLAGIHVVAWVAVFTFLLLSKDPQAALILSVLVPFDPWLPLLSDAIGSLVIFAILAGLLGTAQWFFVGWVVARVITLIRNPHARIALGQLRSLGWH